MSKHAFDPLSLIVGLLFLLGGIPLLVSSSGFEFFDARWVFPAFLVVAGLIVIATSQFSNRSGDDDDGDDPFSYQDPISG